MIRREICFIKTEIFIEAVNTRLFKEHYMSFVFYGLGKYTFARFTFYLPARHEMSYFQPGLHFEKRHKLLIDNLRIISLILIVYLLFLKCI